MNPLIAWLQRPEVPAVVPAAMLQAGLKVSQPTLSRLVRGAGDQLLRIGKARATRYALTRAIGRAGRCWPLYRIDAAGRPQALGMLHALARSMWWWSPDAGVADAAFRHGEFASGLYPGWPWFLDDLRPQGFLGRAYARRLAPVLDAPEDPRIWRDEHILLALLQDGDDAPGDLVLGENALRRWRRVDRPSIRSMKLRSRGSTRRAPRRHCAASRWCPRRPASSRSSPRRWRWPMVSGSR